MPGRFVVALRSPVPIAVELQAVSYTYPGRRASALEGVSLVVNKGERLGILGPNGGGKSTLLKVILGLLTPSSGVVRVFGQHPAGARAKGLIGYVPQRGEIEIGFPLSVREGVLLGASWQTPAWCGVSAPVRARVEELLALVGALEFAEQPIGRLSGGQLQRAMIARALAGGPEILILDEPAVGIDAAGQGQFADLLAGVHARLGITMVIVSHDIRAIAAGCDRVACLSRTLHFHAAPAGLTPQVLAEVFAHDVAGLTASGPLAGMHIHAHGAGEACPAGGHEHPHKHEHGHGHGHGHNQPGGKA